MKSLIETIGALRVRSERLDVKQPTALARGRLTFSSMFKAPALSTTGVQRYGSDPTLFPIVSALAQDTAAVKFRLYRPGPTQNEKDREEVKLGQHPAVDLFNNPNPFQSGSDLREACQQHIDLVGETTILVETIGRLPIRLWCIPPWKLEPVKSTIINTPATQQFLLGWTYTADDGTQIPLKKEQIIQIKLPDPANPWRGIGPVQAALMFLDSSRYSAEWNRNFFLNSATPDGVIQVEESFSDDEFYEFTERWRETHQGLGNAHRIAVLENGAVFVPNQMSQRDMQFQELQQLSSDFIRRAFRFPKTMLGSTDDANRAVAEAGEYVYGKWMIHPRAERWKSALNDRLLPLFGEVPGKLFWDFDPVVESDEQTEAATFNTRATGVNTLILSGFDADEVLATAGLPPMKWTKPEIMLPTQGFDPKEDHGDDPPGTAGGGGRDGADGTDSRQSQAGA